MILKDHDGGIHFVHGGHHRAFPPHKDKTFGTDAKTAVRAATRSRSHASGSKLPRLLTLRDGDPTALHKSDPISVKVEAELQRVASAANLSGSEAELGGTQRRSMSVVSDRTTRSAEGGAGADDDTQSHKGGGSAWSTGSGFGYAPYRPSAMAIAIRTAAASKFDVEFHVALNDMPNVVRDDRLHRLTADHEASADASLGPAELLLLDVPMDTSPTTLRSSPNAFNNADATGIDCLRHLSSAFGVDAASLVTRAMRLEEWLGLREKSELNTPTQQGFQPSLAASQLHHQRSSVSGGRDITLDDIEALLGQSQDDLFELFVRLGAHDADDPRAVAAAAKFAAAMAAESSDAASAPSSPVSNTSSRRTSRQTATQPTPRRNAPAAPQRAYHYTQVPWYSAQPDDEDGIHFRTRCILPVGCLIQDTLCMPKAAATCMLIQTLPDLGVAIHWNGTIIVPPGSKLDFGQFSDIVHLYRYLLARHDDTTLADAMRKRLVDMKKSAASLHRHHLNAQTAEQQSDPMSRAKKSFVRAKSLIMKLKQSDFSASQSIGLDAGAGGSPHQVVSDGDDENDDDTSAGRLTRGASRASMRRLKTTPRAAASFKATEAGSDGILSGITTQQPSMVNVQAHVLFGPTVTATIAPDDESGEAQAILELLKRVEEVKGPAAKPFPEASKIPPIFGKGAFGKRRRQLARVPSRLMRDSFTGVRSTKSAPQTPQTIHGIDRVDSSSSSSPTRSSANPSDDDDGDSARAARAAGGAGGEKPPFRYNSLKTRVVTYEPIYEESALPYAVPVPPTDVNAASDAVFFTSNPWKAAEAILNETVAPAAAAASASASDVPPSPMRTPSAAEASLPVPTPTRAHASVKPKKRVEALPKEPKRKISPRPSEATPPRPVLRLAPQSPEAALKQARAAFAKSSKKAPTRPASAAVKRGGETPLAAAPDAAVEPQPVRSTTTEAPAAPVHHNDTEVARAPRPPPATARGMPHRNARPQSAKPNPSARNKSPSSRPNPFQLGSATLGTLQVESPRGNGLEGSDQLWDGFELTSADAKGSIFDAPGSVGRHNRSSAAHETAVPDSKVFHEDVMDQYRRAFRIL